MASGGIYYTNTTFQCTYTESHYRKDTGRTMKIHLEAGCMVKTRKHTIDLHKISPTPLQMTCSWDPFKLPSTMLTDPQHLDHMLYETVE